MSFNHKKFQLLSLGKNIDFSCFMKGNITGTGCFLYQNSHCAPTSEAQWVGPLPAD